MAAPLSVLSGVSISDESDLVSTDRTFAPDLVSQVKKAVIDEVDGQAGWSVVTVNRNGVEVDVLTDTPPEPAPSFSVTLDRNIQVAAQNAVNARVEQAMMVVIEPSTGAILAVAQNEEADRDGPVASAGFVPARIDIQGSSPPEQRSRRASRVRQPLFRVLAALSSANAASPTTTSSRLGT